MISVVVYGRNDGHGYNLHKRMALSLNSIAEALDEQEDEIVFVDWNSPAGIPPVTVAIADTLSSRAKNLLRTVVVPGHVHQKIVQGKSQKIIVEPVARNVGVRRARSDSKWILSTNTDVLLTTGGKLLSSYVRELQPGYYGSPRFELPEWVWESLSRTDAEENQLKIGGLMNGGMARNRVKSYHYSVFDGCGDFQLIDRSSFEKVGGFDETMLLGWHVDSNFARRVHDFHGASMEFSPEVGVFHCNHNRSETHYFPSTSTANSLPRYVFGDVPTIARSGVDVWGLPQERFDDFTLNNVVEKYSSYFDILSSQGSVVNESSSTEYIERLRGVPSEVSFPFIADRLFTAQDRSALLYLGNREKLKGELRGLCQANDLSFMENIPEDFGATDGELVIVVDLSPLEVPEQASSLADLPSSERVRLRNTLLDFKQVVQKEIGLKRGNCVYIVINAEANELSSVFDSVIQTLPTQYYARIRIGTINKDLLRHRRTLSASLASLILQVLYILGIVHFWESVVRPQFFKPPSDLDKNTWKRQLLKRLPGMRFLHHLLLRFALSPRKKKFLELASRREIVTIPIPLREDGKP